jgi:hypothetical protein
MTDPTESPPPERKPLSKPICTQRAFRQIAEDCAALMLPPPWHIVVKLYDYRKGQYPHDGDHDVYACAVSQAHYHRLHLHAALHHPGWVAERSVEELVRHEIAHSFFAPVGAVLEQVERDDNLNAQLNTAEETGVDLVATMPIFRLYADLLARQPRGES